MNLLDMHQAAAKAYHDGNPGLAIDILEKALQQHPQNPWLAGEMAGILIEMGRRGVAIPLLTLACSMQKEKGIEDWRHWATLGSALEHLEQRELAREAFQEALRVDPSVAGIWNQIAGTYVNAGEPQKCIEAAKKALELDPNDVIGRKHLGLGLLEAGDWENGWAAMEYRKLVRDYTRPKYPLPDWTGQETDTLIIHGEQGVGDELMYLSLIPKFRDKVKRLVVEVTPRLVTLMRRSLSRWDCEVYGSMDEAAANGAMELSQAQGEKYSPDAPLDLGAINIVGLSETRPNVVSCASLPFVLKLGRKDVCSPGYLMADPVRVDYWREKMARLSDGKPIIGITWEGGVRATHKKVRNPPFEMVRKFVADHPEFCWVSVQYTHGEVINKSMPGTLQFQQALDDFDEQAALISALDMLVSVPQTAVHVAGAMAVPTIAIVSKCPRWDFCSDSEQMPWWESVRMIRQTDTWEAVFVQLDGLLDKKFKVSRNVVTEAAE